MKLDLVVVVVAAVVVAEDPSQVVVVVLRRSLFGSKTGRSCQITSGGVVQPVTLLPQPRVHRVLATVDGGVVGGHRG